MRRRWIAIALAILVVVVLGGVLALRRTVSPPAISAFYRPPAALGADRPGQILRVQKISSRVPGARIWRMLYTSTDLSGTIVAVSALVAAPAAPAPAGGYPLVAVGHGTVGINRGCAPSIRPFARADGDETAYDFFIGQYVTAGYAVVMSDYEGLGVAGPSSYLVGDIEGRDVLDSARAVRDFADFTVRPGVLIAGQSQGGQAALFAGQLAPAYAPGLKVLGVVALAPATDLETMFLGITKPDQRGGIVALPVMAADAYAQTYPGVPVSQVLTTRGRGALRSVIQKLCLFPAILGTQLARPSDLLQPGGLDVLKPYVLRNTPGTAFGVPVFLGQGEADQVVPPGINTAYAAQLCAAGVRLTFRRYPGTGHFDVVAASEPDVLAWMQAVRDGRPPASTCAA